MIVCVLFVNNQSTEKEEEEEERNGGKNALKLFTMFWTRCHLAASKMSGAIRNEIGVFVMNETKTETKKIKIINTQKA